MPRDPAEIAPLLAADRCLGGGSDVELVPVAVFWGRAPQRENSLIELFFSEDWADSGRLRRFFTLLVHGRDVLVKIGEPIAVAPLLDEQATVEILARKVGRLLRVYFQEQRAVTVGPDLSHRRLVLDEVLDSRLVVTAVRREVRSSGRDERRVRARARTLRRRDRRRLFLSGRAAARPRVPLALEPPVRGRRRATSGALERDRRRERAHLCSVSSQSHRLHAARIRDLSSRHGAAAHRGRSQSQSSDRRAHPAARRRVFHSPLVCGQCALHGRVPQLLPRNPGERISDQVLHRRNAQPLRKAFAPEARLAADDGAKLRARSQSAVRFRAGLLGLREGRRRRDVRERARRREQAQGVARRIVSLARRFARALRQRPGELRRADLARARAR